MLVESGRELELCTGIVEDDCGCGELELCGSIVVDSYITLVELC